MYCNEEPDLFENMFPQRGRTTTQGAGDSYYPYADKTFGAYPLLVYALVAHDMEMPRAALSTALHASSMQKIRRSPVWDIFQISGVNAFHTHLY